MTLDDAITLFLNHRRRLQLTPGTLANYTRHTRAFATWRTEHGCSPDLANVTLWEMQDFIEHITKTHTPHTAASYWRDVRGLWNFLTGEGLISQTQALFFANRRIPRPRTPDHEPRPYCDDEKLQEMLDACGDENSEAGARDRAIICMLFETGLRVSELAALTDDDVDLRKRYALVEGKGGKKAYVYWGPTTSVYIIKYRQIRRGQYGGPLFRSVREDGRDDVPMNRDSIRHMFRRLGVELPKGSPVHFLRHGFAHKALDAGLDLSQVQQLMRHSQPKTTMIYLRERPEKLQRLHDRIYRRKPA